MKNPREIYQKLREVKHRHKVLLYKKYLKRIPENCKYNHLYTFIGQDNKKHEIKLCMLHQNEETKEVIPHLLDVCNNNDHCLNCNAFVTKYTKDDIKEMLTNELKDKKTKQKKYPDICALEWVLEKSVVGFPPLSWIQKIFFNIKRFLTKDKIL